MAETGKLRAQIQGRVHGGIDRVRDRDIRGRDRNKRGKRQENGEQRQWHGLGQIELGTRLSRSRDMNMEGKDREKEIGGRNRDMRGRDKDQGKR